jgi:hypothetical protein
MVNGFRYLPRQSNVDNGRIRAYEFYVSTDGNNWGSPVATGSFPDNSAEQEVRFAAVTAAAIRLVALSSYDGDPWTSVAEINVLGESTGNDGSSGSGSGGSSGGTGSGDTGGDTGGSGSGDTGSGSGDSGSGTGDTGSGSGDSGAGTDDGDTGSGDDGSTLPTNTAPVISGNPAGSVAADENYSFRPNASDADGDDLVFSILGKPDWASFNSNTGRLTGTLSNDDAGNYKNIVIAVTDGTDTVSLPAFSIRVNSVNTAPVISGNPAGSVAADENYSFRPNASDADDNVLAFSIANKPGWASFSDTTGRLSGTPNNADADVYDNITHGRDGAVAGGY